jgi:hypothetical protein
VDDVLAIMFTMTTYGSWLRGDPRGWTLECTEMPADSTLESADRERSRHAPYAFTRSGLYSVGSMIGESLRNRLHVPIWALSVQTTHTHFIVAPAPHMPSAIAKCAKDAVRWGIRPGRPIWTKGYDKRYCCDHESLMCRIEYVEANNSEVGMPPRPWSFIEHPPF